MVEYGVTWWGDMWLNALRGLDYDLNRIPRGKTYANTNKVYDVKFKDNQISAKVKGKYKDHYITKARFRQFTSDEKDFIIKVIDNSPSILAALLNGELPIELYDKLSVLDIEIFPASWKDMDTSCNCPDYTLICKHTAALIYITTREIDKDPFNVFKFRGLDLFDILDQISNESDRNIRPIKTFSSMVNTGKVKDDIVIDEYSLNELLLKHGIDFTKIPDLLDSTFNLLKDSSLFYDVNFKEVLDNVYRSMARYANRELKQGYIPEEDMESYNNRFNNPDAWPKFTIDIDNRFNIDGFLTQIGQDETGIPFANHPDNIKRYSSKNFQDNSYEFIAYGLLSYLNRVDIKDYNYNLQFLNVLRIYILELIKNKAILPEIIKIFSNYKIIWNPSNYNNQIRAITTNLCNLCPEDLISYNNKPLPRQQQVDIAINIIISGFIKNFLKHGSTQKIRKQFSKPIFRLFFIDGDEFNALATKKQDAFQINQWLSNFSLKDKDYSLYLFIDETDSGFSIDFKASLEEGQYIRIHDILTDKKYEKNSHRLQILADSYLIKDLLPDISQVVDYGKPLEYSLEVFSDFFKNTLGLFENIGLKIVLPKQLQEIYKPKIKAKISTDNIVKHYLSLDDIVNFNWEIVLAGQKFSKEEFEKLLEKSNQLVKINDRYVFIDERDVKSIIKQFDKLPKTLNKNQLLQTALTDEFKQLPVDVDIQIKQLFENIKTKEEIMLPNKLNANLRDYQVKGFKWLAQNIKSGFGSILADDMGLGKTLQVLTTILKFRNDDGDLDSTLIIAPTGLLSNWENEINKFTPSLSSYIYHGTDRKLPDGHYDIILTSYGVVRKDYKKLNKRKWFLAVIDEAQNIKNPKTQQTRAVKSIKARHKIAITGTPIENRLSEYWSIFDFINKQYLGTQRQFTSNYIVPIEVEKNTHVLENFKKITNPFLLRRLKTDKDIIKELPEKITNDIYCSLTTKQAALYKETIDVLMDDIENNGGDNRRGLIFKLMTSLKEICNHPSQYTGSDVLNAGDSGKLIVLMDILETILQNKEKVLIFTQYVQMGNILKEVIEGKFNTEVLFLHGQQSRKKKDGMVNQFQNNPLKKIFILSLKAGGTGLNLTKANNVIHYDLWWNPSVENQATDRAYRIGQKSNVMVYRLITKGTFEEKINQIISDKKELVDMAVASDNQFITEMDNDQLKEIFELRGL